MEVETNFKTPRVRSPKHLAWVRGHRCIVPGCRDRRIVAHHVRVGGTGGTALLPPDSAAIPMCHFHHMAGHDRGWRTFERARGLDLTVCAAWLAFHSRCLGILK